MLDFKTALANGLSREDIIAQLEAAEAELKAEANKNEELDMVREEVITAVADYLLAIGILPPETTISKEAMDGFKVALKNAEKELRSKIEILNILSTFDAKPPVTQLNFDVLKPTSAKDADMDALEAWLKTI